MASYFSFVREGAHNIRKHPGSSIATIAAIAVCLSLIHGLIVLHAQSQAVVEQFQQKFSFTVYVKDSADPYALGNLMTELEKRPEVTGDIVYTSPKQAAEIMQKTFGLDAKFFDQYHITLPSSLTIPLRSPDDLTIIQAYLKTNGGNLLKSPISNEQRQKSVAQNLIDFLDHVRATTVHTVVLLIIFFIVGGALLISSAVHQAITSRKLEMSIMKLVGASHENIVGPYVAEGILLALAAFAVHLILLAILPFDLSNNALQANALILELVASIALSAVASFFTASSSLRKNHII